MVRFHSKSSQKLSATWFSSSAVSWTCYKTNPSDRRVHTISYSFCQHWAFLWACMRKHSVRQNCDHFLDFRWLHRHTYRWRRSTMKEMPVYSMGWSPLRFHHTSQPWLHLGQSATSSMPLSVSVWPLDTLELALQGHLASCTMRIWFCLSIVWWFLQCFSQYCRIILLPCFGNYTPASLCITR